LIAILRIAVFKESLTIGGLKRLSTRTSATIALRASGYRTVGAGGHHVRTIESLELTISAPSSLINRLKALSKKRNATSYDVAGNVSNEELKLMLQTAAELNLQVRSWLKKQHPELSFD
jgi:hypothetical protein